MNKMKTGSIIFVAAMVVFNCAVIGKTEDQMTSTKEKKLPDEIFEYNGTTFHRYLYENGVKQEEVPIKNGNKNGLLYHWYKNGVIRYTVTHVDGAVTGFLNSYDVNGKLLRQESYKNNLRHGFAIRYYPSGVIKDISEYQQGKKIAETVRYSEKGERE
jgi:antitoxin component YwqK of YwqJK toxin-antitoxin module